MFLSCARRHARSSLSSAHPFWGRVLEVDAKQALNLEYSPPDCAHLFCCEAIECVVARCSCVPLAASRFATCTELSAGLCLQPVLVMQIDIQVI